MEPRQKTPPSPVVPTFITFVKNHPICIPFYIQNQKGLIVFLCSWMPKTVCEIWFRKALATVWELRVFSCCKQLVQHELLLRKWEPNWQRYVVDLLKVLVSVWCTLVFAEPLLNKLAGKSKDKFAWISLFNKLTRSHFCHYSSSLFGGHTSPTIPSI